MYYLMGMLCFYERRNYNIWFDLRKGGVGSKYNAIYI